MRRHLLTCLLQRGDCPFHAVGIRQDRQRQCPCTAVAPLGMMGQGEAVRPERLQDLVHHKHTGHEDIVSSLYLDRVEPGLNVVHQLVNCLAVTVLRVAGDDSEKSQIIDIQFW